MRQKIKDLAPQILDEIKKSNNILMHCHPSPDPDSVGSTLAFGYALEQLGKEFTIIYGDSPRNPIFECLPGFDKIIDKNFFEMDLSLFDLYIAMDSGGLNQISGKGEVVFPDTLKVINIDHHNSNPGYGDINLVEDSYIANGEIVYDLFKEWDIQITPEIAQCLFLSIYTDSGGFKYERTDRETFLKVSELAAIYPDFCKLVFKFENSNRPERIYLEGIALNNISTYFSNSVAFSIVGNNLLKEKKIIPQDIEKSEIANQLKSVVGWNITVSLIEKEPNKVSVSFRSRDTSKYDVSKIAALLGGGGHKAAAGTSLLLSLQEAIEQVQAAIQKLHPELGNP